MIYKVQIKISNLKQEMDTILFVQNENSESLPDKLEKYFKEMGLLCDLLCWEWVTSQNVIVL